jgi:hypothetical protein
MRVKVVWSSRRIVSPNRLDESDESMDLSSQSINAHLRDK